jgi:hypothetical protein
VTMGRRALVRAGVVMLLAMGALAVGSPAFAANVGVTVNSQFTPFKPGDAQLLKITVSNGGASSVTVSVSGLRNFTASNPQGCDGGGGSSCTVSFGGGNSSKDISFSLTATGNVDSGQSRTDHGRVTATQNVLLGGGSATAAFDVTLTGPQQTQTQAPSIASVSGVVRDAMTSAPLRDALVVLVDSGACASGNGREPCQTGTDSNGQFTFASAPDRPLAPGTIRIGASKSGYEKAIASVDAGAGQSVTITVRLKPTVAASSSASPDALPSAEGQQPTADAVAPTAAALAPASAGDSGSSVVSWIVLVLAGLLVVLGVGVFVMMFLHRRNGDADEDADADGDADGDPPSGPDGVAMGAGSGIYGGAVDGADPTMVADPAMTSAMASPGASDSTAIFGPQRPEDEFPDPYAAACPGSAAGYPQAGSGYGADAGYGGPPAGYSPPPGYSPDHSYGSGGGSPGYDGATRHWDGGADGSDTGGEAHSQEQSDYEAGNVRGYGQQQGGYDLPAEHDHGYPYDQGYPQDHGYPRDQHGGGYDPYQQSPYQQQQPTEAPTRRGALQAGHDGDRQRPDWFGN